MKIFLSVLLILILIISIAFDIDESAMLAQDEALDRAMIAFALAKGLNAVISLIQGTELSLTPVGIGLTFSVGEVLDPFNDMVERFSWVMLASTVSLGIQKIILTLSAKAFLQVALVISGLSSVVFIWFNALHKKWYFLLPFKIMALLIILRFTAVLSVYTSDILYTSVLHVEYKKSSLIIQGTQTKLELLHENNKHFKKIVQKSTWYESDILKEMSNKYKQIKSKLDISKQIDNLKDDVSEASNNIINLITIFILQSIIMPLIFIWLMLISIRSVFSVKVNSDSIALILK